MMLDYIDNDDMTSDTALINLINTTNTVMGSNMTITQVVSDLSHRELTSYLKWKLLLEDDLIPAGMSPSFHHIQNKQRKKKGFK